jgi:hypothetical protein
LYAVSVGFVRIFELIVTLVTSSISSGDAIFFWKGAFFFGGRLSRWLFGFF